MKAAHLPAAERGREEEESNENVSIKIQLCASEKEEWHRRWAEEDFSFQINHRTY